MNEPQREYVGHIDRSSTIIGVVAFVELLVIFWFGWRL